VFAHQHGPIDPPPREFKGIFSCHRNAQSIRQVGFISIFTGLPALNAAVKLGARSGSTPII
jgi:hypothetical protein